MQQIRKILQPFLKKLGCQPNNQPNIEVSDFRLIWRPSREYLQINNFFKVRLCHFSTFIVP